MAGLTTSGFVSATVEEIRVIIANALKANLGASIDTNPSSRIGQFIDIVATELFSLWQGLEAVYASQFPVSASGVSLDNIGSITNTLRSSGVYGLVRVVFGGQLGSVIPQNSLVSNGKGYEFATQGALTIVENTVLLRTDLIPTSDAARFFLMLDGYDADFFEIYNQYTPTEIIDAIVAASKPRRWLYSGVRNGTKATIQTVGDHPYKIGDAVVQTYTTGGYFDGTHTITAVPTPNTYEYADASTALGLIIFDQTANENVRAKAQASLPMLTASQITVDGQFSLNGAVWIRFNPAIATQRWYMRLLENNMYAGPTPTVLTVNYSVATDVEALGTTFENFAFPTHSVSEIVSSVFGVSEVTNLLAGRSSKERETDAAYRQRLTDELQNPGGATITGIRDGVKSVLGVTYVAIVDNPLSLADSAGRPPHSMEVYVEGGTDNEVAQKIYDLHPAGVQVVSTALPIDKRTGNIIDVNGTAATLSFSKLKDTPIRVEMTLTIDPLLYPPLAEAEARIQADVVAYVNALQVGEPLYCHKLIGLIDKVPGVKAIVIGARIEATGGPLVQVVTPPGFSRLSIVPTYIVIITN
jgi:uncharacterized phage protein gp47/JayE